MARLVFESDLDAPEEKTEAVAEPTPVTRILPAVSLTEAQVKTINRLTGGPVERQYIMSASSEVVRRPGGLAVSLPGTVFVMHNKDGDYYYGYTVRTDGKYEQEWIDTGNGWTDGINDNIGDDHVDLIAYRECEECGSELSEDQRCENEDCDEYVAPPESSD